MGPRRNVRLCVRVGRGYNARTTDGAPTAVTVDDDPVPRWGSGFRLPVLPARASEAYGHRGLPADVDILGSSLRSFPRAADIRDRPEGPGGDPEMGDTSDRCGDWRTHGPCGVLGGPERPRLRGART